MRNKGFTPSALLIACVSASLLWAAPPTPPDLIVFNARIYTGVASQPWAEALAIRGDRIDAVGTTAAVRSKAGAATHLIDAGGKLVIPGIKDAHDHPGAAPDA